MPRLAISSSKSFDVPQRPVLTRIVGMPSAYASSIVWIVWSMFFFRTSASGETKPWCVEKPLSETPFTNARCLSRCR